MSQATPRPRPLPADLPERRLAPVLHFVSSADEAVEQELRDLAARVHRQGQAVEQVCYHLTARALALGYTATIAMQEVSSRALPSFPGQEVIAPILLLDLRPLRPCSRPRRRPSG